MWAEGEAKGEGGGGGVKMGATTYRSENDFNINLQSF